MSLLLETILSDDEEEPVLEKQLKSGKKKSKKKTKDIVGKREESQLDNDEDEDDDMNANFKFGMGMDLDIGGNSSLYGDDEGEGSSWSYKSAMEILLQQEKGKVPRMDLAHIVAAARKNIKKSQKLSDQSKNNKTEDTEESKSEDSNNGSSSESENDSDRTDDASSDSDDQSDSDSESEDEIDDLQHANENMETDVVRDQIRKTRTTTKKPSTKNKKTSDSDDSSNDGTSDSEENDNSESSSDDEEDNVGDSVDEEEKLEAAKQAIYFKSDETKNVDDDDGNIQVFSQLNLSRPLLRGCASMGYVTPTKIQAKVIPVALSGRDICASACTGSGKTAAFLLPICQSLLQQQNISSRGTKGLILTPTRELAAQCLSMLHSLTKYVTNTNSPSRLSNNISSITSCLIVGGNKNLNSQAAELRNIRPDIVIGTPGRVLDHLTNSRGVHHSLCGDTLEFLVLDEADRLLDLGFQDEILEIVKQLNLDSGTSDRNRSRRQTLLFSATMNTKVDDLIKLSLKRPVRIKISTSDTKQMQRKAKVDVAPRLTQEFIRIRPSNEPNREAILLSLLTRAFCNKDDKTICFFDTKDKTHRFYIICGLCGINAFELHGNLTQAQRLEALEEFRKDSSNNSEKEGKVLLCTDLAARGLDIQNVQAVLNFDFPKNVDSYVHRIGRTARAGQSGRACTLIGEGRRHLMKEVIQDAHEKNQTSFGKKRAIVRSRTVPQAVVSHFYAKITSLEPHIESVLQAEQIAKLDRLVEMETVRAKNMIIHREEIQSRPAREWFKGKSLKKAEAEALKEKEKVINQEGTGSHRMTRKKRRAREAKEELKRFQQEMREEQEANGNSGPDPYSEGALKASARSAKKEFQEQERERFNRSLHEEDLERDQRNKKRKARALDVGDSSLFDQEQVMFQKKKRGEDVVQSAYDFRGYDPDKKFGRGGKKSTNSFKSKSKYKRR